MPSRAPLQCGDKSFGESRDAAKVRAADVLSSFAAPRRARDLRECASTGAAFIIRHCLASDDAEIPDGCPTGPGGLCETLSNEGSNLVSAAIRQRLARLLQHDFHICSDAFGAIGHARPPFGHRKKLSRAMPAQERQTENLVNARLIGRAAHPPQFPRALHIIARHPRLRFCLPVPVGASKLPKQGRQ